ncbi:hypothetical protein [Pseudobacteroides cellulosolvens]|uniref:Uncharacterized protein n=1 Tax=Pseudobacteroides cellulosolvens ATCC 35603 = DSM 2933 TaxID=398512 RepID=A0A0L6JPE5_9FIRM|nr:hypothetical protein [Pseudobacteroides cellulosolvens]KNY27664.1 hypothetical protein Bccel_2935 [Pseudobacteroides cellulosolvens ATCC 35603 = DSM 2933]
MENELFYCCNLMIKLLENLLLQNKITLEEFEKEVRLKRIFIEEIFNNYDLSHYSTTRT